MFSHFFQNFCFASKSEKLNRQILMESFPSSSLSHSLSPLSRHPLLSISPLSLSHSLAHILALAQIHHGPSLLFSFPVILSSSPASTPTTTTLSLATTTTATMTTTTLAAAVRVRVDSSKSKLKPFKGFWFVVSFIAAASLQIGLLLLFVSCCCCWCFAFLLSILPSKADLTLSLSFRKELHDLTGSGDNNGADSPIDVLLPGSALVRLQRTADTFGLWSCIFKG